MPTIERSIVDAVRQRRSTDELICHAIENYLDFHGTLRQLQDMAEYYNMLEEFNEYMLFYEEFMEDFYTN